MKKYLILIFICFPLHAMNINMMNNLFNNSSRLSTEASDYRKKELIKSKNYCKSDNDKKLCILVNKRKNSLSKLRFTKTTCNDLLKANSIPEQCIKYNNNSMYDLVMDWNQSYPKVKHPINCDC